MVTYNSNKWNFLLLYNTGSKSYNVLKYTQINKSPSKQTNYDDIIRFFHFISNFMEVFGRSDETLCC